MEYSLLRQCTKSIPWLAPVWWGDVAQPVELSVTTPGLQFDIDEEFADSEPTVTLEDWILLDAMYRSRALEWPGEGEGMIPAIDMANHTVPANAEFKVQTNGDFALLVKEGVSIKAGEEIFISYGDFKSPLEVLFSYGFLPDYSTTAQTILLTLPSPGDDPLGPPKVAIMRKENYVPGIRIYEEDENVKWDSEVLWLLLLNEEDGLSFRVAYGPDGDRELDMTWKDEVVRLGDLKAHLQKDPMWELFELRASVIILGQIDEQISKTEDSEAIAETTDPTQSPRAHLASLAQRLRSMEKKLLYDARDKLQEKVS